MGRLSGGRFQVRMYMGERGRKRGRYRFLVGFQAHFILNMGIGRWCILRCSWGRFILNTDPDLGRVDDLGLPVEPALDQVATCLTADRGELLDAELCGRMFRAAL